MLDEAMFDPPILLNRGELPQLPMSSATAFSALMMLMPAGAGSSEAGARGGFASLACQLERASLAIRR